MNLKEFIKMVFNNELTYYILGLIFGLISIIIFVK